MPLSAITNNHPSWKLAVTTVNLSCRKGLREGWQMFPERKCPSLLCERFPSLYAKTAREETQTPFKGALQLLLLSGEQGKGIPGKGGESQSRTWG